MDTLPNLTFRQRRAMRISCVLAPLLLASSPLIAQDSAAASIAAGRILFESQCSRCHGVNGTGGVGPALNRPVLRRAPTDDAMVQVILAGIPGTAMVGFWNFSATDAREVTAYIRSLGRRPAEVLSGDPGRGEAVYAAHQCGSCHILRGVGAGWAPDLSDAGLRLSVAQIREALNDPGAAQPISPLPSMHGPYPAFLGVEAQLSGGEVIRGTRVTEDDFVIVIRDTRGAIHSLDKRDIWLLTARPRSSPMPAYGPIMTRDAMNDLIAFVASQRRAQ